MIDENNCATKCFELRFASGIITPASLATPAASERPYAGYLSAGVHSHFQRGHLNYSIGLDVVVLGPQTRVLEFHRSFHESIGSTEISEAIALGQVPNGYFPTLVFEVSSPSQGANYEISPFVEVRYGVEDIVRIGLDVSFGILNGSFLVRDMTTGQRYAATGRGYDAISFELGADVAAVADSAFLFPGSGVELHPSRLRARAGIRGSKRGGDFFYGITWLGREFEGQPEGQLVGSVQLSVRF
jgi:hypothetical protein